MAVKPVQPPDKVPLYEKDPFGQYQLNPRWSRFFSLLKNAATNGIDEIDSIFSAIFADIQPELSRIRSEIDGFADAEDLENIEEALAALIIPSLNSLRGQISGLSFIPNDDIHFTFDDSNDLFKILDGSGTEWARFDLANQTFVTTADSSVGINLPLASDTPSSTLQLEGSFSTAIGTLTSDTILNATHHKVSLDGSSNSVDAELPTASSCAGREYWIYGEDAANALTITPNGSDTIAGSSGAFALYAGESLGLYSNGTSDWRAL